MPFRVKYKEIAPNIFESVYNYRSESTGAIYSIIINKETMTYKIKNINSGRIYEGGEGINNYKVLLRNIKYHLWKLGVNFDIEIQKRK